MAERINILVLAPKVLLNTSRDSSVESRDNSAESRGLTLEFMKHGRDAQNTEIWYQVAGGLSEIMMTRSVRSNRNAMPRSMRLILREKKRCHVLQGSQEKRCHVLQGL